MTESTVKNQASKALLLAAITCTLSAGGPALSQGPAEISGPIDIQANEQEFAGEQVIARGNVRVKYKDSVIIAPVATLTRSPEGSPKMAVFTGHPRLTQAGNAIDADTLTFDIANHKIVADGHAHSEVMADEAQKESGDPKKTASTAAAPSKDPMAPSKGEKIITDSDRQEYDRGNDKFEAFGHVHVKHGNINVHSEKLSIVYGANKKPETAIFTGNVIATQDQNATQADTITYSLTTKRLQATGHVRSKVIQQKAEGKKGSLFPTPVPTIGPGAAMAATISSGAKPAQDETILINSDSQDYSKETGRLSADGNVRIYYQDTVGAGPQCILIRNAEGKAERVIFTGRSQISQPGKRWIADHITFTVADRKVLAEGNTKAIIMQTPKQAPRPEVQLAGKNGSSISSRKVDRTQ
jgi:lipopolysaccharide transport protein LptA